MSLKLEPYGSSSGGVEKQLCRNVAICFTCELYSMFFFIPRLFISILLFHKCMALHTIPSQLIASFFTPLHLCFSQGLTASLLHEPLPRRCTLGSTASQHWRPRMCSDSCGFLLICAPLGMWQRRGSRPGPTHYWRFKGSSVIWILVMCSMRRRVKSSSRYGLQLL